MDSSGVILTPEGTFSQPLRMNGFLGRHNLARAKVLAGIGGDFLILTPITKYPISGMLLHD